MIKESTLTIRSSERNIEIIWRILKIFSEEKVDQFDALEVLGALAASLASSVEEDIKGSVFKEFLSATKKCYYQKKLERKAEDKNDSA